MFHRSLSRFCALTTLLGCVATVATARAQDDARWTRKFKTPPQASRIQVTVLKDGNGKPIEDAHVIFHPIQGDRDKGYLELKTNEDGKAIIDVIPIGDTVRLQVMANGFQTYGADYKIDKPSLAMEIRLKRPGAQYSIYEAHDASQNSGDGQSGAKPDSQSGQNQQSSQPQTQ